MKTNTNLYVISFLFTFIPFAPYLMNAQAVVQQDSNAESHITEAAILRYSNSERSISLLDNYYKEFLSNGDTTNGINAMLELSESYGHNANYRQSYDILWQSLLIADDYGNELLKAPIYTSLGNYYSYYKREEESIKYHLYALDIQKNHVEKGQLPNAALVQTYWAISSTYRILNRPDKAKSYLDSCFMYYSPTRSAPDKSYLLLEEAHFLDVTGEHESAQSLYNEILPWYKENAQPLLVLVYTFMANNLWHLNQLQASENFYLNALSISDKYKSHIDFTPIVHEKLSMLYRSMDRYEEAYLHLKKSKELDSQFFDSRSTNNRPLLEIQDAYRTEKDKQHQLEQEQKLARLEHEDNILLLQKTILIGTLLFMLITGLLFFKYIRTKHRSEKQILQKQKELEVKNANELIELKNKELAAYTLQMIARDETLATLKKRLKKAKDGMSIEEVQKTLRSITISKEQNWEEFRARFIAVNQDFYTNLNNQFPQLSRAEQKLCALIKLKFSSKEIAKLLGISNESVQTSRYRLRKKLALTRESNLTEFISTI